MNETREVTMVDRIAGVEFRQSTKEPQTIEECVMALAHECRRMSDAMERIAIRLRAAKLVSP